MLKPLSLILLLISLLLAVPVTTSAAADKLPDLGDHSSSLVTSEQELKLGRAWLRQVRGAIPLLSDPLVQTYVESITYRLAFHSDLRDPDLRIIVVKDSNINAFAVPGGVVGVNAGLIIHSETEAEMASVLAHELAHLSQRHFARRLEESKRNQWVYLGALLTSIAVAASSNSEAGMALATSSQAALVQNQLSYSRLNEQEADRIGMQTLVNAGLNPHAMPTFFSRLMRHTRQSPNAFDFLSTHPVTHSRISDSLNRANQYPQKLTQDNLDYQLIRTRILVGHGDSVSQSPLHYQQALKDTTLATERGQVLQFGLALALNKQRQHKEAKAALAPLLAKNPMRVDYLIAAADIAMAEQNYAEALAIIEKPYRLMPDHYALQMYFSRLKMAAGLYQEAIAVLDPLTRSREDDLNVWYLLSDAYMGNKDTYGTHRARAEVFFLSGQDDRALAQLDLALKHTQGYAQQARIQKRKQAIEASRKDIDV